MALGTGRRPGRVQTQPQKNAAGPADRANPNGPLIARSGELACGDRVFPRGVDHAPGRARITHRAAHGGRRASLADSGTAARDRRQLRGGLHRAGRGRLLGRRGGRRGLRGGLRTGASSPTATSTTVAPAETGPSAPAAPSTATTTARCGGTTTSTTAPGAAAPSPSSRAASEALAPTEAPGADRAARVPARRAADVPQAGPQEAAERAVPGVADAAHHRPGGVRRCRPAAAVIPLTRRDACPNGSF